MVRRLVNPNVPFPNFEVLVTEQGSRKELYIAVDHYFRPDASDDRGVICLGLGSLDKQEFEHEVDKLIGQLQTLKQLASKDFQLRSS